MADIKIPDDQLSRITAAAIAAQLEPGTREQLIQQAIEQYLLGPSNNYGRKSKLVELIEKASEAAVLEAARRELAQPAFADRIETLVRAQLQEVFDKSSEQVTKIVDHAVDRALSEARTRGGR